MSHLMKGFVPAAVLGLVLGAAGQAKAALTFSTAGPTIGGVNVVMTESTVGGFPVSTATVGGVPVSLFVEGNAFSITTVAYGGGGNSASRDLVESPGGLVSDRVLVTASGNNTIAVLFASDNILGILPPVGSQNLGQIQETGAPQYLFTAELRNAQNAIIATYNFIVQSDAPPTPPPSVVPEPGAIALALSGLPVLGMLWARRRRVGA